LSTARQQQYTHTQQTDWKKPVLQKTMKPDYRDIESDTLENDSYRKVVYTVKSLFQLVLMSLAPGETIPTETHPDIVQFVRVEAGQGVCVVDGVQYLLRDGISITIPNNSEHYFENTSKTSDLKMYIIYAPDEHPPRRHQRRQTL